MIWAWPWSLHVQVPSTHSIGASGRMPHVMSDFGCSTKSSPCFRGGNKSKSSSAPVRSNKSLRCTTSSFICEKNQEHRLCKNCCLWAIIGLRAEVHRGRWHAMKCSRPKKVCPSTKPQQHWSYRYTLHYVTPKATSCGLLLLGVCDCRKNMLSSEVSLNTHEPVQCIISTTQLGMHFLLMSTGCRSYTGLDPTQTAFPTTNIPSNHQTFAKIAETAEFEADFWSCLFWQPPKKGIRWNEYFDV